jgi:3-methyl-2-oxobutanoate hydroxymethyltransferase
MSATPRVSVPDSLQAPLPMTLPRLAEKKRLGEPIVMVTAYDYPSAQVAQAAGVDVVLVGDSGAMTVLGYPSTVPVSTEEMLMLAAATRRGLRTPLLVGDLPFGSYEASDEQAIATAQRFIKEAGCDAVKLERGGTSVARARAIVESGIPVMGHIGLTPQTATALGGYRAQGRTASARGRPRRPRPPGRRLFCDRVRGDPGRRLASAHAPARDSGDRHRSRAGHRRPGARIP